MCKVTLSNKTLDKQGQKKREKVQEHFWNIVGAVEHISLPKLECEIKREFNCNNGRLIHEQVILMQSEGRINIQSKVKVWLKQPLRKI